MSRPEETNSPPRIDWTREQSEAIHHAGCDLLVSAAAGSGKTAVLAERCAWLVCDAPRPCDVDQLLVVTFTKAASAQMKQRIGAALRRRLERLQAESNAEDPQRTRLPRQLALLDRASISTLHGFCDQLVRRHHAQLGLDPAYKILDPDEAMLLRRSVARDLFEDGYDRRDTEAAQDAQPAPTPSEGPLPSVDFQRFIDDYGDGNDEWLLQRVLAAHDLLQSIVDPDQWRTLARRRVREAAERPLDQSELGIVLGKWLSQSLNSVGRQCQRTQALLRQRGGFSAYEQVVDEWIQMIRHWLDVLKHHGLAALGEEVTELKLPRLPSVPRDVPGKDAAKGLMDNLKDQFTKGVLPQLLRFTPQQWREGMEMTLPFTDLFLDLVEQFGRRYAQAKNRRRALDFSDLERYALAVLRPASAEDPRQPSPAALDCRRRFRHVLVDEYQDINEVQDAILSAVGGRPAADDNETAPANPQWPASFFVGDVKQSIYRFRLADPGRFQDRMKRFRNGGMGRVIDLQHNFRSRGPLLEAINAVFIKLMTDRGGAGEIEYDAAHHLRAGRDFPSLEADGGFVGAPIELHVLPAPSNTAQSADGDENAAESSNDEEIESNDADRAEREAMLIARRIREMMKTPRPARVVDGDGVPRPLAYRDIVILLRSTRHKAGAYARVLRRAGVPVHSGGGRDFFSATEVRDMLALLRVLDNPNQDIPLAAVLRGPLAGNAAGHGMSIEEDLAAIRIAFAHEAEPPPFHEAVRRYAAQKQDALSERLRGILSRIDQWRSLAARRPVAEVIWTLYQESGFLTYAAGLNDGPQREANLLHLYERARQFGGFQRQGLMRFLQFLDQLAGAMDEPSILSEAEDVVRIMTIHSSKGLEFPVVFLADLGKTFNMSDLHQSVLMDRAGGIGLKVADERLRVRYPSLAWSLLHERLRRQGLAEELRLLYVAMTRAKECLICIGSSRNADKLNDDEAAPMDPQDGPLPPEVILSAKTPLDWLLAAAGAMDGGVFNRTVWEADEVKAWSSPQELRPKLDAWQADRAALRPLPAPSVSNDQPAAGKRVMNRLTWVYPYEPFTRQAASLAVTQQAHRPSHGESALPAVSPLRPVDDAQTATLRGSAVHEALRFIDFARPCDAADLREQLETLCADGRLSREQLGQVDLDDLCWMMRTPPGQLLRTHAGQLRRELPFTWARPPEGLSSPDPLDRRIVRGRLDALIPTERGPVLVDYKTDRVRDETLEQRIAQYKVQLHLYGEALRQVTGRQPAGAWLVFLHARQARDVMNTP